MYGKELKDGYVKKPTLFGIRFLLAVLLRVRLASRSKLQMRPYKMLYGIPFFKTKHYHSLKNYCIIK